MKFLTIGCGSIGRRHIQNLLAIGEKEVIAADINDEYRKWVENNLHIKTYGDVEKALKEEKPDIALVCTPPNYHVPLAKIAVEHDSHIFMEKPISGTMDGVDDLIKKVNKKKLKAMVGYNQRFNDVIIKVKGLLKQEKVIYARILFGQYLPDWRPWQDYKKSYTAQRKMGGGIILDDSHELDYARWIFGEPDKINAFSGKLSSLEVDVEDTAEIILQIKDMLLNIHMDFVRRDRTRYGEAVSLDKTVSWDLNEKKIEIYHGKEKRKEKIVINQDINDTYVREIRHFIDAIKGDKEPLIPLSDAKKTLELALKIKKAAGLR